MDKTTRDCILIRNDKKFLDDLKRARMVFCHCEKTKRCFSVKKLAVLQEAINVHIEYDFTGGDYMIIW